VVDFVLGPLRLKENKKRMKRASRKIKIAAAALKPAKKNASCKRA
jgi:hypothetical protein